MPESPENSNKFQIGINEIHILMYIVHADWSIIELYTCLYIFLSHLNLFCIRI